MPKILIDKEITGYPITCKTAAAMNAAKAQSNVDKAFLFTGKSTSNYTRNHLYILQSDLTFNEFSNQNTIGSGDYVFDHFSD